MPEESATKTATKKTAKRKKKSRFNRELAGQCERLLGARVASMEYPGGKSRESVRLILKKGAPVYVTKRSKKNRADIERLVLKTLSKATGKVPKLLASDAQKLLIQEEIRGLRLSQAIHQQSDQKIFELLDSALASLAVIQQAGSESGLDEHLPRLGKTREWLVGLLDRPAVLGRFFEIPAPKPQLESLETMLAMRNPRFVKWDSRPGNAIARENGEVVWIDWEHSGCRNRLDDMVWLLGDEFIPYRPKIEAALVEKHLPIFADDLGLDQAREYFYGLGVFHLTVRLGLIYKYKEDGNWWSYEKCLARDKAGVTLRNVLRILSRGEDWAEQCGATQVLSKWFRDLRKNLS